ncbi:hypothetical protein FBU59_005084 [Linderina macrospora]|uniref:Uncharacterized protein n=1 Tax=Linderina macrospora TaxID=4868 RepID=A0ACC1J3Y7_9FUNG|nr:hypothetical protein FBU59_005084 [Linderina macrospora]
MVTYELFPELLQDDTGTSTDLRMDLTGSNYELFTEIANIIGEASSTTVSQEAVDKSLPRYRLETRGTPDDAESSVAKLIVGEDGVSEGQVVNESVPAVVHLVSAERCPVCLEDFNVGDVLRVLKCHHGLHLVCGDSWFTRGANKSEAVPKEPAK